MSSCGSSENLRVHTFPLRLGDRMELPGFRELEYSTGTKEHKTTQNTRVEATQTRREMVGNFFFNSFSLEIKSFLQYFCVVFITKWLPWQPYITKPIINYELVVMATGFHDNHTKLFNFQQYISCYRNNKYLHPIYSCSLTLNVKTTLKARS